MSKTETLRFAALVDLFASNAGNEQARVPFGASLLCRTTGSVDWGKTYFTKKKLGYPLQDET